MSVSVDGVGRLSGCQSYTVRKLAETFYGEPVWRLSRANEENNEQISITFI